MTGLDRAAALDAINDLKKRMGWEFPSDPVPDSPERSGEPIREPKPERKKLYERCSACEEKLTPDEQPDGVCLSCLRQHQTHQTFLPPKGPA